VATTERDIRTRLAPVLSLVAKELQRRGIESTADVSAAPATLYVERKENVRRIVQVYWTPFQADIPGASVGLHLEIPKPRRHWVEGYIAPRGVSWIFAFAERPDGEYQLVYYEQHSEPNAAIEAYFNIAAWYGLTACDLTWDDVAAVVSPEVGWTETHSVQASSGEEMDKAVQESLKKSTILWLRWSDDEGTPRTMPVWFLLQGDKIYVLSGERQQTIPGAEQLRTVDVILRWKGKNSQVADLPADVRVIGPDDPDWDEIAEKIAEKRLNIPGAPEATARRWRDECVILELKLRY
jgi:hypothetical protein